MCGIAGYIGTREPIPVILDGLRHLEYRGYDSAGLCVVGEDGLKIHKVIGRVADLVDSMPDMGTATLGIGHTRWATHGEPSTANAHPHLDSTQRFAVVHNGIIENAAVLRAQLEADGIVFASMTDTEVLAHLISAAGTDDLEKAVQQALSFIEGSYGIAVVDAQSPDRIVLARNGSPVVIGIGDGEHFVASDAGAFARFTSRVIYLEDHELAVVEAAQFRTSGLGPSHRPSVVKTVRWEPTSYETGEFGHFMQKEIHEQPKSVARAIGDHIDLQHSTARLAEIELSDQEAQSIRRVKLFGCGSAYYAGLVGAGLIETVARIPANAEAASEFRYRNPVIEPDTLYVAISQSGETLDTLQAIREIQRQGGKVLGVVNSAESSIARACDHCLYLDAGPEISVTSTKTFTSTAVMLALLAIQLGQQRSLARADARRLLLGLSQLPARLEEVLQQEEQIVRIAEKYAHVQSAFFIGRVNGYPVALEGSQKLKEVSYIHAEAYPCAELKHGPLALITPLLPTIAIVPSDSLFAKNVSTLAEIRARRGPIIAVGHSTELKDVADDVIIIPKGEDEIDALLLGVPLQLLAYHTAVSLGLDIDKPRNLAKSVTVE